MSHRLVIELTVTHDEIACYEVTYNGEPMDAHDENRALTRVETFCRKRKSELGRLESGA